MPRLAGHSISLVLLLIIGIALFFSGIHWGLPSHAADPYLFGQHPRWSGDKIMRLAGQWQSDLGADVEAHPTTRNATGLTPINLTDAERARIIRRYRLYSYQPDEWLTFRALSQIKAHHGDPRVYQYGGLWFYPVGALLKLAGFSGYLTLNPNPAFYIDHPSLFGRFYVVARAYSAIWGLLGMIAVWLLLRYFGLKPVMVFAGSLCFLLLPVVINSAHEAKPHLAGTALLLWMVLAAAIYARTGKRRWWWAAAILAGCAAGMVLTGVLGWIALPVMMLLRPVTWRRRVATTIGAMATALLVYLIVNPFVLVNAIADPAILRSNLGNSAQMYPVGGPIAGISNTVALIGEGTGRLAAILGLLGAVAVLIFRKNRPGPTPDPEHAARERTLWPAIAPALLIIIAMAILGAGKPAEYGRFALFPNAVLVLCAFLGGDRFLKGRFERVLGPLIILVVTGFFGLIYLRGFWRDASAYPARLAQAASLQHLLARGATSLATVRDPAPYNLPPVDVFDWHLYLLPASGVVSSQWAPDVIVRPVDQPAHIGGAGVLLYEQIADPVSHKPFASPISWADKPMEILRRRKDLPDYLAFFSIR